MLVQLPLPQSKETAMLWAAAACAGLALANLLATKATRTPPPRRLYVAVVVLLFGVALPSWALAGIRTQLLAADKDEIMTPAPLAIAAGCGAGLAMLVSMWARMRDLQWRLAPKLVASMIAPSLAETIVFIGLIFVVAETLLSGAGPILAPALAAAISSAAFGLYHLTHRPPWTSWGVIRTLIIVWLGVCLIYILTRSIWAAAAFNTCMAGLGMVRHGVTGPAKQSWLDIGLSAGAAIGLAALIA